MFSYKEQAMSSRLADEEDDNDKTLSLFVLGPGAVGKTSLTIRFISDDFMDEACGYSL